MVDQNIADTTSQMEALGNQANSVGDVIGRFFDRVRDGASKAGIKLGEVSTVLDTLSTKITEASKSFDVEGASASLSTLQDPLDSLIGSFEKLNSVVDQSKIFQQFADNSGAAINTVTLKLDGLQKIMSGLKIPGADKITGTIADRLQGLSANATESEKLEQSFVALSAAGGDLSKIFDGQGGELKDLSALTMAYSNTVAGAADATGLSVKQSMDFANALKTIPGVMDQYITTGEKGEKSTTALIATMQLMTGTGRSQAEVMQALNTSYDKLSQSQGAINDAAQKGAEYLATISSVSTGLKLKFDDVKSVMEATADQFKFIGNETDGAAKILGRYTDALKETGLTSKASLEITQQMITGMKDMTTGTKAFLSLKAGGPGGLQGAFQIEQLMRQGKIDEVMKMAENALKQQFGGKIYTQAEAAQSPEAASQFMRQRQLLQSGVFGIGKGMGDEQSTRLLEALGKGDTLAATKEIKTGQNALTAVTKQGTDIQVRNNNELKTANRFLERNAIAAELSAGATIRGLFGAGRPGTGGLRDTMATAAGSNIAGVQNEQRLAMERGGAGTATQAEFAQQFIIGGRQAINMAMQSGKNIAQGAVEGMKGIGKLTSDTIDAAEKLIGENKLGKYAGPQIHPAATETKQREAVYANTTMGRGPTHTMPSHVTAPATDAAMAAKQHAAGGATPQDGARTIRLEITAPEHMTVKKSTRSAVHAHNAQSTVINFDEDLGY